MQNWFSAASQGPEAAPATGSSTNARFNIEPIIEASVIANATEGCSLLL